ncbi:MAG: DUF2141 domain-containing protein [Caulobacteraceae bacterium]|nr:DUF2141 domain-containing protein [Caulobacteraceae bacterium]
MTARSRPTALMVAAWAGMALGAQAQECAGTPGTARLLIVVERVDSAKGLVTATLYPNDKSQFLVKGGALKVWSDPAAAPTTRMCLWLKGPGTYALAVYHDANADRRFNVGLFGPTEAYGFSNNPRIAFSKPSLQSVLFQAGEGDTTVHVRLNRPG